jgi:hypothetical protein
MGNFPMTKIESLYGVKRHHSLMLFVGALILASCSNVEFEKAPVQPASAGPVVCGPFRDVPTTPGHGLVGDLYALSASQCNANMASCSNTTHYIQESNKVMRVEMADVNVPTRSFSEGFVTSAGQVKYPGTDTVVEEWFGLKLKTQIQLAPGQTGGKYQFAILADDGVTMRLADSGSLLISDNQIHPSKISCSNYALDIQPGQKIPV